MTETQKGAAPRRKQQQPEKTAVTKRRPRAAVKIPSERAVLPPARSR